VKSLIIVLLVAAVSSSAGTAEAYIDVPFNEVCILVSEAFVAHDPSAFNYGELDGSITVKTDWSGWRDYESWSRYVLPAYIWSTDIEARAVESANISPSGDGSIIKAIVYWELEAPSGGWMTVESNNGQAEVVLNALVKYCEENRE
jgi:hypothetical protein